MEKRKFTRRKVRTRQRATAIDMRREPTDAEQKLWLLLRGRRLAGFKFRRQVPIGPYIADFVSFSARVVVEVDGSQHQESPHDLRRDRWLVGESFTVVRYWNHDVLQNPDGVLIDLLARLGQR